MDALRRSSRISRKERIRNVAIRQQIGLEEPIIKEIEQNQLTWYGHVQRMAEARLPKIALKWMPKQKTAQGRPMKNWMEGIRKAMDERNLNEGQWEDRKQWSLGVGQRRTAYWNRQTYIQALTAIFDVVYCWKLILQGLLTCRIRSAMGLLGQICLRVHWFFHSQYLSIDVLN